MTDLSDAYLLMIEPQDPPTPCVRDEITEIAKRVWMATEKLESYGYHGVHVCSCGVTSDNHDHLVPGGMVTNSLLLHYISAHRAEVPQSEIDKLRRVAATLEKPG